MPWKSQPAKPKRVVRDYHKRQYGNPLFGRASGRSQASSFGSRQSGDGASRGRLYAIIGGCAAVLAMGYVFWGPQFRIQETVVAGSILPATEQAVQASIERYAEGRAFGLFPRNNVIFFRAGKAREAIDESVYLEYVDVRKKLPGTITIDIKEKNARAVYESEGRLYALDEKGTVIRELIENEVALINDLPPEFSSVSVPELGTETVSISIDPESDELSDGEVVEEEVLRNELPLLLQPPKETLTSAGTLLAPEQIRPGLQATSQGTINFVLEAYGRLPDIIDDSVRWFTPDPSGEFVDATTGSGWHVFLSTSIPFDTQAERLAIVLKEKIGNRLENLQYVNLRYNEKIYFKMKEDPGSEE